MHCFILLSGYATALPESLTSLSKIRTIQIERKNKLYIFYRSFVASNSIYNTAFYTRRLKLNSFIQPSKHHGSIFYTVILTKRLIAMLLLYSENNLNQLEMDYAYFCI